MATLTITQAETIHGWTSQHPTATHVESGHVVASGITKSVVDEAQAPTAGLVRTAQHPHA